MGEQTRQTLRGYFRAGQLPTEDHFGDLVDSMLNMKDEGFRKTPDQGLQLSTPSGHDTLLSFYRDDSPLNPAWALGFAPAQQRLQLSHRDAADAGLPPALTLDAVPRRAEHAGRDTPPVHTPAGATPAARAAARAAPFSQRLGINTAAPQHTLDVAGVIGTQGRIGTFANQQQAADGAPAPLLAVPANGEWQNLLAGLEGCQAFEVMAGVGGGAQSGRYALLHAVAMSAYNPLPRWLERWRPQRGIRATSAHYGRRCDRLQLRWAGSHGAGANYALQIRTGCNYGPQVVIRFALTRLWFDPLMAGGRP